MLFVSVKSDASALAQFISPLFESIALQLSTASGSKKMTDYLLDIDRSIVEEKQVGDPPVPSAVFRGSIEF
jgi:hypothetical protein